MRKVNKRNLTIVILGALILVALVIGLVSLLFKGKDSITFKFEMAEIEYGSNITYADMIEELKSEDAEVTYPETPIKEVGTYHVTFLYEEDGEVEEVEHSFKVVDTKKPTLSLYVEDDPVEVSLNKQYDLFSNVMKMTHMSDAGKSNRVQVSMKEWDKEKEKIEKASEEIKEREVTGKKVGFSAQKDILLYATDLDTTKTGTYTMKLLVVDENYNYDEKTWEIEVVEKDGILNSGGSAVCQYTGNIKDEDAYETTVEEYYTYNPLKVVDTYEIVTTMTFHDGYHTENNASALVTAIENKYASYGKKKGVTVTVERTDTGVVTRVKVNFNEYDIEKDPLNIMAEKDGEYVKMQQVLDDAKGNNFTCTLK